MEEVKIPESGPPVSSKADIAALFKALNVIHVKEKSDLFCQHAQGWRTSGMYSIPRSTVFHYSTKNWHHVYVSGLNVQSGDGLGEIHDSEAATLTHPYLP